jgi:competence protein ComEC
MERGGRRWRVLATTGRCLIPRDRFAPACAAADIVVCDRRRADWCQPRWQ